MNALTIAPPIGPQAFFGVFANHTTDREHLDCFEDLVQAQVDLSLRFMSLRDILTTPLATYPFGEAQLMVNRGGALYLRIKLSKKDLSFLSRKRHAKALETFTRAFTKYHGRIFVEPYFEEATEQLDYATKQALIKLLAGSLQTSRNITWVWNPALGNQVAGVKTNWVSINATQQLKDDGTWTTFEEEVAAQLNVLLPNQSAIMFVASAAPASEQNAFIQQAMSKVVTANTVKGVVVYNAPIVRGNEVTSSSLTEPTYFSLGEFMANHQSVFAADLNGQPESRPLANPDAAACLEVTARYENPFAAYSRREINETIAAIKSKLPRKKGTRTGMSLLQNLVQQYIALANLEKRDKDAIKHIKQALFYLQEPLAQLAAQKDSREKPDRYPLMFNYFDLKLQLAALYTQEGGTEKASAIQRRVLEELANEQTIVEQQTSAYEQAGYQHRVYLELGIVYEQLGKLARAQALYQKADTWATREQARSWVSLFWRGENRTKLRYIAARARIGLARISLRREEQPSAAVLDGLKNIFAWEEACQEDGFMDQGFQALIYLMRSYLNLATDPAAAKRSFNQALPWTKINEFDDFKVALDLEGFDLASPYSNRWDMLLEALPEIPSLDDTLNTLLVEIKDLAGGGR